VEKPNQTWKYIFKIYIKIKNKITDWVDTTHKQIYQKIRDNNSKTVEITNIHNEKITWEEVVLANKNLRKIVTSRDRETQYRIAHNGYKCGSFYRKTNIYKNYKYRDKIINSKVC